MGESAAGHQIMDMRMVTEVARPGLQHTEKAQLHAEMFWVGGDVLEGSAALSKEQVVAELLPGADSGAQLRRHGEGDQEVGHGQKQSFLFGDPGRSIVMSALGTGAVVAGVIGAVLLATVGTTVELPTQLGCATTPNGRHSPPMRERHPAEEFQQVRRPVAAEDLRQIDHLLALAGQVTIERLQGGVSACFADGR